MDATNMKNDNATHDSVAFVVKKFADGWYVLTVQQ
jgi:hypothetical protein